MALLLRRFELTRGSMATPVHFSIPENSPLEKKVYFEQCGFSGQPWRGMPREFFHGRETISGILSRF